jgi:hypothetical protein
MDSERVHPEEGEEASEEAATMAEEASTRATEEEEVEKTSIKQGHSEGEGEACQDLGAMQEETMKMEVASTMVKGICTEGILEGRVITKQ